MIAKQTLLSESSKGKSIEVSKQTLIHKAKTLSWIWLWLVGGEKATVTLKHGKLNKWKCRYRIVHDEPFFIIEYYSSSEDGIQMKAGEKLYVSIKPKGKVFGYANEIYEEPPPKEETTSSKGELK